jgi:hypothetical protein
MDLSNIYSIDINNNAEDWKTEVENLALMMKEVQLHKQISMKDETVKYSFTLDQQCIGNFLTGKDLQIHVMKMLIRSLLDFENVLLGLSNCILTIEYVFSYTDRDDDLFRFHVILVADNPFWSSSKTFSLLYTFQELSVRGFIESLAFWIKGKLQFVHKFANVLSEFQIILSCLESGCEMPDVPIGNKYIIGSSSDESDPEGGSNGV